MPYQPTQDDIQWMKDYQKTHGEGEHHEDSAKKPNFLHRLADFAEHSVTPGLEAGSALVNKLVETLRAPEIAGGFLQSAEHGAASAANIPLGLVSKLTGKDVRVPYADLQKYTRQDPTSRMAFTGGEVAGAAVPAVGAYKALSGARALPGVIAKLGRPTLAAEMGAGAGAGAATGAQTKGDLMGRGVGAAIGGVAAPVSALLPKRIAGRIVKKKKALEGKFSEEYHKIFDALKKSDLHKKSIRTPSPLIKGKQTTKEAILYKNLPTDARRSLQLFEEDSTFKGGHKVQSDLGKVIRREERKFIKKSERGQGVLDSEREAVSFAKKLRKNFKGSMQQFLKENNKPNLIKDYRKTTERYAKEVGPFKSGAITAHTEGDKEMSAKKLLRALQKEKSFTKSSAPEKILGFSRRKKIEPVLDVLKKIGLGAAIGGGSVALGGGILKALDAPGSAYLSHFLLGRH